MKKMRKTKLWMGNDDEFRGAAPGTLAWLSSVHQEHYFHYNVSSLESLTMHLHNGFFLRREGARERGRERGRQRASEGGGERGSEGGSKGGSEGGIEGGSEGGREVGRERGSERGTEGSEGVYFCIDVIFL